MIRLRWIGLLMVALYAGCVDSGPSDPIGPEAESATNSPLALAAPGAVKVLGGVSAAELARRPRPLLFIDGVRVPNDVVLQPEEIVHIRMGPVDTVRSVRPVYISTVRGDSAGGGL